MNENSTNDKIQEIMDIDIDTTIIDTVEAKSVRWYGHVRCMGKDRLPRKIDVT